MRLWRRRDKTEAKQLAEQIGLEAVQRAPDALRHLVEEADRFTRTTDNGTVYQVVVCAYPMNKDGTVLRVEVAVDGGPVSAMSPVGWGDEVELADE